MPDVLVLGGGIIGLSIAWQLSADGASVSLLDPSPGSGATTAAAGMLAPVTEAHYGEEALIRLNLESATAWPAFARRLESESGLEVGYDASGTLAIGFDPSDKAALDELHGFQVSLGLDSHLATALACRRAEPLLAPSIRGGLDVPGDHQVDPRKVTRALLSAGESAGVRLLATRARELLVAGGRCQGARDDDGREHRADWTVVAAGWQAAEIGGLPAEMRPPVRPVKGQILRLRLPGSLPRPRRTIRALVRGSFVYLVPRAGGEVVCGATSEELGPDTTVTAGAVYSLLRDAQAVLPILSEAELTEAMAGLRPGSPDNAPMIGPGGLEGLAIATGHFRHGILLTPITVSIVADLVSSGTGAEWEKRPEVDPRRFSSEGATEASAAPTEQGS